MTTPTLEELLAQQKALAQQIEDLRHSERAAVLTEIRALVDQYALTADDIFSVKKNGVGSKPKRPRLRCIAIREQAKLGMVMAVRRAESRQTL